MRKIAKLVIASSLVVVLGCSNITVFTEALSVKTVNKSVNVMAKKDKSTSVFQELKDIENNSNERYIVKFKADKKVDLKSIVNDVFVQAKNNKNEEVYKVLKDNDMFFENYDFSSIKDMGVKNIIKKLCPNNVSAFSSEEKAEILIKEDISDKSMIYLPEKVSTEEFISEVEAQIGSEIEYIQPDYMVELLDFENEYERIETQAAFEGDNSYIIQEQSEELSENLDNVKVALIDSGVDFTHTELQGRLIDGYDFYHDTDLIKVNYNSTEDIHATHIAGIIASQAENAQIMPLKVFDKGKAYTSDIIEAIEYAKEKGAQIVNCSWGGSDYNLALKEAIDESGLLFVCAAGNESKNIDQKPIYPACYESDNIMTACSVNDDLGLSGFSNYGENSVDIAAKGRDIYSLFLNNEYGTMSGTSVAAGFVSAAAAVCVGQEKTDIKTSILNSSDGVSCLEGKVINAKCLNLDNIKNDIKGGFIEAEPIPDVDINIVNRSKQESWELFCLEDNVKVATSDNGVYILKTDGTVWMHPSGYSVIEQVPTIKNIVYMTDDAKILIDKDGKAYSWCGVFWTPDDDIYEPEELTGITNAVKAYSDGFTFFVVAEDGTTWGWGANIFGQAGGTEKNWYYDEDGIIRDEGYLDVVYPQIIEYGSKNDMLTVNCCTYILSEEGQLTDLGAYDYILSNAFSKSEEELYKNIAHLAYTSEHELVIIYENGKVLYRNYSNDNVKWADFTLTGVKETSGNIVMFDDGRAGLLHYNMIYDDDGRLQPEGELLLSYIPVEDVKSVKGAYNSKYYAIKNDDTLWNWYVDEFWNQSEAQEEALENGIGHGTVLIAENYAEQGSDYYRMNQEELKEIGWSEQENEDKNGRNYQSAENGEILTENSACVIKKTLTPDEPEEASMEALVYAAKKQFIHRVKNWMGDSRVSMWTNNFKGIYAVEYTGTFDHNYSQVYYDMLGKTSNGEDAVVGRYRIDSGTNGYFSVYNNKLNGADTNRYHLWQNPRIKRDISTYMDTTKGEFRTFLSDSGIAVETIVEEAYPKNIFKMTDWNPKGENLYFTGIRISGQRQEDKDGILARIEQLRLVEYEDTDVNVKAVAQKLNMSYLTDTPDEVRENLKELPESMDGMDITWTSSLPDIITNEGIIVGDVIYDTNVVFTAKITDPQDGFTRYLDFNIVLVKPIGMGENYLEKSVGQAASQTKVGSTTLREYPKWKFEYPGLDYGINREIHSSQVLTEKGYMIFKKLSDRQTDSYKECLVGKRYLSYSGDVYSFRGKAELMVTAKAEGTGTFRFAPEALDGTVPFSIALDASNRKVFVVYSEDGEQTIQDLGIDPITEHDYKMVIDTNGSFELYIDNEVMLKENGETKRAFLDNSENPYNISKIKTWITNITKENTKVGYLKSVVYTPKESYDTEDMASIWKDIETFYREKFIPTEITEAPLVSEELVPTFMRLFSGNYDYINYDFTIYQPIGIDRGGYTTILATFQKNNTNLIYKFGVHVPHFKKIQFNGLSNGAKTKDNVGVDIKVKDASVLTNKKFTLRYDSEQFVIEDLSMLTPEADTGIGEIDGTDIVIMKKYDGLLEFVVNTQIPEDKLLSTVVNAIKLKSLSNGDKEIMFTVEELK